MTLLELLTDVIETDPTQTSFTYYFDTSVLFNNVSQKYIFEFKISNIRFNYVTSELSLNDIRNSRNTHFYCDISILNNPFGNTIKKKLSTTSHIHDILIDLYSNSIKSYNSRINGLHYFPFNRINHNSYYTFSS